MTDEKISGTISPAKIVGFVVLTTTQRNDLVAPPNGVVIYNETTNQLERNTGTPEAPVWTAAVSGVTAAQARRIALIWR